jgi:hypothetical protein
MVLILFSRIQVSTNPDTAGGCGGPTCGRPTVNAEPCSSVSAPLGNSRVFGAPGAPVPVVRPPAVDTVPFDGKWRARQVDRFARKTFPLAFLSFSIVYWLSYTVLSPSDIDAEGEIPITLH